MFGFHPVNLAFRFVLELAALAAMVAGSWALTESWDVTAIRVLVSTLLPVVAALAWGTFNVPGDRSRSGDAPVPVPGLIRLIVEFDVFAVAVFLLWFAWPGGAVGLGVCVVVHYLLSIDRIAWLLGKGGTST